MSTTEMNNSTNLYIRSLETGEPYLVRENPDGSLLISSDGETSILWAKSFIRSFGGVESVKRKCFADSRSLSEIRQEWLEKVRRNIEEAKRERAARIAADYASSEAGRELSELIAKSERGVIDATIENLRTVAWYLRNSNYGTWHLPQMNIGYRANAYDSGAVTIVLDKQIEINGEMYTKFAFWASCRELTKYYHCR